MSANDQAGDGERATVGHTGATGAASGEGEPAAHPTGGKRRGMPAEFLHTIRPRRRLPYGRGECKIDLILKEEDRAPYRALVNDPRQRQPDLLAWLRARGYEIGMSAVAHHRRKFRKIAARVQESGCMAMAFADLARDFGEGKMAEATIARSEQLLLQQFMGMAERQNLSGEQWTSLNKA